MLDTDQTEKLGTVLLNASAGHQDSIGLIVEAIGNDDRATEALVDFMDGVTTGDNPTLLQLQFNQQLTTGLFKHIAEYIVRD